MHRFLAVPHTETPTLSELKNCQLGHNNKHFRDDGSSCSCKKGDMGWFTKSGKKVCRYHNKPLKGNAKCKSCLELLSEYNIQRDRKEKQRLDPKSINKVSRILSHKNPVLRDAISHTPRWENPPNENLTRHSFRIDSEVWEKYVLKRTGKKGRKPKKVGRPVKGNTHLIRKEALRLFHTETRDIIRCLKKAEKYKPGKRKLITSYMPDLSVAIDELKKELEKKDPDIVQNNPVFDRGWAPTLCRLIEIKLIYLPQQSNSTTEHPTPSDQRIDPNELINSTSLAREIIPYLLKVPRRNPLGCEGCGSRNLNKDEKRGELFCNDCGRVQGP